MMKDPLRNDFSINGRAFKMRGFIVGLMLSAILFWGAVDTARGAPMLWVQRLSRQEMLDIFKQKARDKKPAGDTSATGKRNEKNGDARRFSTGGLCEMFYLYSGSFPEKNMDSFLKNTRIRLEDPDGSMKELGFRPGGAVMVPNKNGGWYRFFAYNDYGLENDMRIHLYSQDSFLNHADSVKREDHKPVDGFGFYQGRPVMEVRHIVEDELDRYRIQSGDEVRVKVFFKGHPVEGALLTLITQKDWQKTVNTDEKGEAVFTLIKEDFPEGKTDKTRFERYVLKAQYYNEKSGNYKGQSYEKELHIATLPLMVYASPLDWECKSAGYFVAMLTMGIVCMAAAIRRKRRRNTDAG